MNWLTWIKDKLSGKYFLRYHLVSFLVVFWAFKQEWKRIWYSLRKEKKQVFWKAVKFLFFFVLLHAVLKCIFISATSLPHRSEKINKLVEVITSSKENFWHFAGILFMLVFLAPIIEECIFRHFVFTIFGKKNPLSYLVSFLSFALAHYHRGENIVVLFFQYSAINLGFIYVYKKSNWNLLMPILLHALINLLFIGIVVSNSNFLLL